VSAKKRFQQLVQAYHLTDVATLEALLDAGVDPDTAPVNDAGDTLLMLAVRQERREAVLLLLGRGASALIANRAGETAHSLGGQASDRRPRARPRPRPTTRATPCCITSRATAFTTRRGS